MGAELEIFFAKVWLAAQQSQEEGCFSPFYPPYTRVGSVQNSFTLFTRPSGS
jgi:hypothetical protein